MVGTGTAPEKFPKLSAVTVPSATGVENMYTLTGELGWKPLPSMRTCRSCSITRAPEEVKPNDPPSGAVPYNRIVKPGPETSAALVPEFRVTVTGVDCPATNSTELPALGAAGRSGVEPGATAGAGVVVVVVVVVGLVVAALGVTYVYADVFVPVPAGVVIATVAAPAVPAGARKVTCVLVTARIDETTLPPIDTEVVPNRLVPTIVTRLPPAVVPALGDTVVMVGSAA